VGRSAFDEKLEKIKRDLLLMGSLVEESITRGAHAFLKKDLDLAAQVVKDDEKINEKEGMIEDECVVLLATEKPFAADLRFIISTLNAIRDLERIGDYAVHLAKAANEAADTGITFGKEISRIVDTCTAMLRDAMKAFASKDCGLAQQARERDKIVDTLYLIIFKDILLRLKEDSGRGEESVRSLFALKYIERLADHIVNICEEIEYLCTGTRKESGTH
jgi:phosphate transport system protein